MLFDCLQKYPFQLLYKEITGFFVFTIWKNSALRSIYRSYQLKVLLSVWGLKIKEEGLKEYYLRLPTLKFLHVYLKKFWGGNFP